jgi:hypothetical protein
VEAAYDYIVQKHADKMETSKQLFMSMKQDHIDVLEKCAIEVD